MGGLLKKLLYFLLGLVGLFIVVAVAIVFLVDPNDYRDRIAEAVKEETGRDLAIEGDLELSFFPWFAISVGRTTLGNAPGFGDEPFLSFEEARASISVLPLIRGDGLELGNIVLDSFQLNLAVAEDGRNNWADLAEAAGESEDTAAVAGDVPEGEEMTLTISSVNISDAAVRYEDARAGESYKLTGFDFETGSINEGEAVDITSRFSFELQPADLAGDFAIETSLVPGEEHGITIGDAEISTMGVDATITPVDAGARLQVDAFSLKSLMQRLNIEPPTTADPDALGKIILDATFAVNNAAITASDVELVVDDTTFNGEISVARDERGTISIDLDADSMDLDRYMEPAADAAASSAESIPVEIPVDLIRALNVRGELSMGAATLSGMVFENVELGLTAADGNMRLHPIAADFFDGKYQGDVRIDASGSTPSLSVDENISGVSLGALAEAMFERQNITGTINGSFRLGGSGADLAAIQRSLDGSISMELVDGAWEGVDVWHQLRRVRALYRQEPAPEPRQPVRTEFSNVRAAGPVVDGVFRNDELFAELPFMQLTGGGTVDFAAGEVDYRMTARILERPEFVSDVTEQELEDFTEAEIPLRVSGPLASPSIAPDIEEMLKKEVRERIEEEVKEQLLKKLLGE